MGAAFSSRAAVALFTFGALTLAPCEAGQGARTYPPGSDPASGVITHVVWLIQENRSFNNLFMGYKGAFTQNYGYGLTGNKIMLHSVPLAQGWDIDHSVYGFFAAYNNGGDNGWNNEYACCGQPANFAYAYVQKKDIKPYWDMAKAYILADAMYQSQLDGSYVAHQYAIAAYANAEVNYPSTDWGCWGGPYDVINTLNQDRSIGNNVPVCENQTTLGDELDAAGVSWRYYTSNPNDDGGLWTAYGSIEHIYDGPDWTNDVITPQSRFITDVGQGNLASMTWITPTGTNSDHAGWDSNSGPAWVTNVVNAVGQSKFWNSTVFFLIWDDWGGWYDPGAPIYKDYDGTGFRIPLIMISPYAKPQQVTHIQYETASILRFAEDLFNVAPLAAADSRAADPAYDPAFDFSQAPRAFVPFKASKADAWRRPTQPLRHTEVDGD